jgi:hypothetical protein
MSQYIEEKDSRILLSSQLMYLITEFLCTLVKDVVPINEYQNIFLLYAPHHLQCRFWYEWKGSEVVFIALHFN